MFETLECLFTLIAGLMWLVSKIMREERQDTSSSQEAKSTVAVDVAASSYGDCGACGKPNPPGSDFCGECGAFLETVVA